MVRFPLGNNGVSMSIGSGGTDISLGTIAGAMAGLSHWGKNIEIEGAAKRNEMANAATGLRGLYGFGDETDKAELESILSGKTKLIAGGAGTGAQTETVNGQRYITLNGVNEADTAEKKLELALVLSHEGRRDGVTDENNKAETRSAVWAHTEIALRMLGDKATSSVMMSAINGNENLQSDLNAYAMAKMNGDDTLFDKYVDGAYDSSADFWKLNRDGTLSFDGNADLYDENGNLIYKSTSRGIQGSLSEILKISSDDAYDLMKSAGMIWDGKTWLNEKNATDGSHVIGMEAKTAGGITYESLYKSVQITDVITGITGTLEKQNPLNIYNTMVATGLMEMGWVFSYDRIEGSFDVTQAPISYEKYKANNFMYSPGYYMISLKDPVNVKHAADDFFGSRINPTDSSKTHNHTATDYGVPEGTPFKPYAEGTVSKVATTDGGGNTLTTNFLYLP